MIRLIIQTIDRKKERKQERKKARKKWHYGGGGWGEKVEKIAMSTVN